MTVIERVEALLEFLRGRVPKGWQIKDDYMPKLSAEQAWRVLEFLIGEEWEVSTGAGETRVPDTIERCDVCHDLFDTEKEGSCLDWGGEPYHFCDECTGQEEWLAKVKDAAEDLSGRLCRQRQAEAELLKLAGEMEKGEVRLSLAEWSARLRCLIQEFGTEPSQVRRKEGEPLKAKP